jgi:hypothetical protein
MMIDNLHVSLLTRQLNMIRAGECALSTGPNMWWRGNISDLLLRRKEFPKADTVTINPYDLAALKAQLAGS